MGGREGFGGKVYGRKNSTVESLLFLTSSDWLIKGSLDPFHISKNFLGFRISFFDEWIEIDSFELIFNFFLIDCFVLLTFFIFYFVFWDGF